MSYFHGKKEEVPLDQPEEPPQGPQGGIQGPQGQ